MFIARVSQLSGIPRILDLPVTSEQLVAYENGALLQVAFPNLSPADREYIKSGITDEEFKEFLGPEI
jgi:hypothetical protein